MSLVVTTYVPEGIIMSSDSRQSITLEGTNPDGSPLKVETVNSDSIYKTFLLKKVANIGVSCFGQDLLSGIPMGGHIKNFEESKLDSSDDVTTVATKLLQYFFEKFSNAGTGFHIAGYKVENGISTPYVYFIFIKDNKIERKNLDSANNQILYGSTWGGQTDILSGILSPYSIKQPNGTYLDILKPPIVWQAMTLQDAVDFSIFAIKTTIDTIRFQARNKNVGGPIDILMLTPEKASWVNRKEIHLN